MPDMRRWQISATWRDARAHHPRAGRHQHKPFFATFSSIAQAPTERRVSQGGRGPHHCQYSHLVTGDTIAPSAAAKLTLLEVHRLATSSSCTRSQVARWPLTGTGKCRMGCPLRNILVAFSALLTFYVALSAMWRPNKLDEEDKVYSKQVPSSCQETPGCLTGLCCTSRRLLRATRPRQS